MRWLPWPKPSPMRAYKWLEREYGRYSDIDLKKNLAVLAHMELLYERIKTERSLLRKDLEDARGFGVGIRWIKSTEESVARGRDGNWHWKRRRAY